MFKFYEDLNMTIFVVGRHLVGLTSAATIDLNGPHFYLKVLQLPIFESLKS